MLAFVTARPAAQTDIYPGDLTEGMVRAHMAMLDIEAMAFSDWLAGDFAWTDAVFGPLERAAFHSRLRDARRLAGQR